MCNGSCRFRGGCVHGLGWALIALGLVGAAVAIAMDVLYAGYWFAPAVMINAPIWGGIFVVVTGGLAVCSGRNPEKQGIMVATLVMSIFAALAAVAIFVVAAFGLGLDGPQCSYYRWGPDKWYRSYYYYGVRPGSWNDLNCDPAYGLHAFQLVLALLEFAFALAVSIMSCCGACCGPVSDTQGAVYKAGGEQVIIMPGGAGPVQPSPQPGQHYPGQQPYPVQQYPGQQPYPVQPAPGQQPPYPVQQQPYPVQQQPYPVQPAPGQHPYPVQQLPYPQQQPMASAPPPEAAGQTPSTPPPTYTDVVEEKK